ncbi:MAG TPA: hypothetical protein VGE31_00530 [Candidatus Paceibacterota bacterium]
MHETDIQHHLAHLTAELADIHHDLAETNQHADEALDHIEARIEDHLKEIDVLYEKIAEAEVQTDEALDALLLGQIHDATDDE